MIYCVIPEPLAEELYPRLSSYYRDEPGVEVVVDRRQADRRSRDDRRRDERPPVAADALPADGRREQRDRRRPRVAGDFPRVDPVDALS